MAPSPMSEVSDSIVTSCCVSQKKESVAVLSVRRRSGPTTVQLDYNFLTDIIVPEHRSLANKFLQLNKSIFVLGIPKE